MTISFERPLAALLGLGLPLLIALLLYARRARRRALERVVGPHDTLVTARPLWRQNLSMLLLSATWLFATVALMGPMTPSLKGHHLPIGEGEEEILHLEEGGEGAKVLRPFHDVIVLIDASASMEVIDTRVGLSRLEYAKEIVDELVSRLDGQLVALYAFTSELTTLVPATIDYLYTRLVLRNVRINEGDVAGTDFAEALDGVRRAHFRPDEKKARTLLLLTDGGDTRLEGADGEERESQLDALLSRIHGVDHLQTFCIGLGSREGEEIPGIVYNGAPVRSSLDESFLTRLSEEGGGQFLFANDYSALALVDYLVQHMDRGETTLVEDEVMLEGRVRRTLDSQMPSLPRPTHHDRIFLFLALLALFGELVTPPRLRIKGEMPCAA